MRAVRNAGHSAPRGREFRLHLGIALCQHGDDIGMFADAHTKGRRDRICGDVVMRRADPAGGEHVGVCRAQVVYRLHDAFLDIRHRTRFMHLDTQGREVFGDLLQVDVAGAPGQEFIADQQHGSSG